MLVNQVRMIWRGTLEEPRPPKEQITPIDDNKRVEVKISKFKIFSTLTSYLQRYEIRMNEGFKTYLKKWKFSTKILV